MCNVIRLHGGAAEGRGRDQADQAGDRSWASIQSGAGLFLRRDRGHEPQPASQPGHGRAGAEGIERRIIWSPSRAIKPTKDVFDGIDTTWSRVCRAERRSEHRRQGARSFHAAHPETAARRCSSRLAPLIAARCEGSDLAERKLHELDETIGLLRGAVAGRGGRQVRRHAGRERESQRYRAGSRSRAGRR